MSAERPGRGPLRARPTSAHALARPGRGQRPVTLAPGVVPALRPLPVSAVRGVWARREPCSVREDFTVTLPLTAPPSVLGS